MHHTGDNQRNACGPKNAQISVAAAHCTQSDAWLNAVKNPSYRHTATVKMVDKCQINDFNSLMQFST
jgi:hypothetical protein